MTTATKTPIADTFQLTAPVGQPNSRLTREFDAPREIVWSAFTTADHMAKWWGPRKYDADIQAYDVRVGGKWKIVQKGDGQAHVFKGEFRIVHEPEVLSWSFGYMDFPPIIETIHFEDLGGRTRIVVEGEFPSIEGRDGMVNSGMESGARESYERLDELLATLVAQSV